MNRDIVGMSRSDRERFFAKTKRSGKCLLWTGGTVNGYGSFGIGDDTYLAHRVAFYIEHGFNALQCNHTCDVRLCVQHEHLYSGTQAENVEDMLERHPTWQADVSRAVGAWHGKISERDVRKIRDAYSSGHHSLRDLGGRFDVSAQTIQAIVSRRTWKHVA